MNLKKFPRSFDLSLGKNPHLKESLVKNQKVPPDKTKTVLNLSGMFMLCKGCHGKEMLKPDFDYSTGHNIVEKFKEAHKYC